MDPGNLKDESPQQYGHDIIAPRNSCRTWSPQQEVILIEFYKAHPSLWQWDHPEKFDRQLNADYLHELQVDYLGNAFPAKEVRAKWRKLKDSFDRNLKKIRQTDGQCGVSWHHFERMLPFVAASPSENPQDILDSFLEHGHSSRNRSNILSVNQEGAGVGLNDGDSSCGGPAISSSADIAMIHCDIADSEESSDNKNESQTDQSHLPALSRVPNKRKSYNNVTDLMRSQLKRERNDETHSQQSDAPASRHHTANTSQASEQQSNPLTGDGYFVKHVLSSLTDLPVLLREKAKLDIQQVLFNYLSQHLQEKSTVDE